MRRIKQILLTFILFVCLFVCLLGCVISAPSEFSYISSRPAPHLDNWLKTLSPAKHAVDSKACGGTSSGPYFSEQQIAADERPADEYSHDAHLRLRHQWIGCMLKRSDSSLKQVAQDSRACGGSTRGEDFWDRQVDEIIRKDETWGESYRRLGRIWERCMMKKNYRYVGACYENETVRKRPKCKGHVLLPLYQNAWFYYVPPF